MRTPQRLFRLILLAGVCQMVAACAMNPFDGDPNGPPPAPRMMSGAYGGEGGDPYVSDRRRAGDDVESETPRREVTASRNDYGTSDIDQQPLPPPVESAALDPLPRPVDAETRRARQDEPRDEARYEPRDSRPLPPPAEPVNRPSGDRVLSTSKGRTPPSDPLPPPPVEEARAPKPATTIHRVLKGEELADVADTYDVREVEIIALNNLKPPYALKAGQELKIPLKAGAKAVSAKPGDMVVAGDGILVPSPKPNMGGSKTAKTGDAVSPAPASAKAAGKSGLVFDWPVSGKVISGFGASSDGLYNEGINIAVPAGTPVRAAASGTVRYAGNELEGYGNLILIEHDGGYVTAYAHNQTLTVKRGQTIERGSVIARSGQTGNVKSPQLHFEIRQGTQSVDPRKLLVAMN